MKAVFMGTPDFALEALKALYSEHDVVCVYTRPPKPAGRGHKLTPSPVQSYAEEHGIPVRTPSTLKKPEEFEAFKALNADIAIVAAYGMILPAPYLKAFPYGCLNIHGSVLPRWRGAAPIQRAIMAGDKETGVTLMQMDEGMDTGDMLLVKKIAVTPKTTAATLYEDMAKLGGEALLEGLKKLQEGTLIAKKQPEEGVTYAPKIDKAEAKIDWNLDANEIDCRRRGLSPYPGAWFMLGEERIAVIDAEPVELNKPAPAGTFINGTVACKTGGLKLLTLQRQGKKPLPVADFLRGCPIPEGTVLS